MIFPLGKISVDLIGDQVFNAYIEKDRDISIDNCMVYGGDLVIPAVRDIAKFCFISRL